jgi:hypothetical protein
MEPNVTIKLKIHIHLLVSKLHSRHWLQVAAKCFLFLLFFRQLIKQNADRERKSKKEREMAEVIIGNRVEPPETPRLVHTVMQAS